MRAADEFIEPDGVSARKQFNVVAESAPRLGDECCANSVAAQTFANDDGINAGVLPVKRNVAHGSQTAFFVDGNERIVEFGEFAHACRVAHGDNRSVVIGNGKANFFNCGISVWLRLLVVGAQIERVFFKKVLFSDMLLCLHGHPLALFRGVLPFPQKRDTEYIIAGLLTGMLRRNAKVPSFSADWCVRSALTWGLINKRIQNGARDAYDDAGDERASE